MMIYISDTQDGLRPEIVGRIPRESFAGFLGACKGTPGRKAIRENGKFSHWLLPREEIAGFTADLLAQGLPVRLASSLRPLLEQEGGEAEQVALDPMIATCVPAGWQLFGHQGPGVQFLLDRKGALLADDMGLGKTLMGSVALAVLFKTGQVDRGIVQAPKSILTGWQKTLALCGLKPVLCEGSADLRAPEKGEVILCSWAAKTEEIAREICANNSPCVWIGDEIHYAKKIQFGKDGRPIASKSSMRALRALQLARVCRDSGGRSWGFSGTPIDNGKFNEFYAVTHVCGIGNALFPRGFGDLCAAFSVSWEKRQVRTKKRVNGRLEEVWRQISIPHQGKPQGWFVRRLAKHMLRRTKDQCLDLPAITFVDHEVELKSSVLRALCDQVEEILEQTEDDKLPAFEEFSLVRRLLAEAKIATLKDLIEEYEGEPLAVFSVHKTPVEACAGHGFGLVTGSVSGQDRSARVDAFQAGKLPGIAYTLAGCEGITLTQASTLVAVDLDWRPGKNSQAFDRLRRIGQGKPVTVVRLIADHPLDKRLMDRLEDKARTHDQVVDQVGRIQEAQNDLLARVTFGEKPEGEAKPENRRKEPITEEGFYKVGEAVFKTKRAQAGHLYALRLEGTSWEYARGAMGKIGTEHKLTLEQAKQYGQLTGICCCCGRTLTNEESIAEGIGPICKGKYFG